MRVTVCQLRDSREHFDHDFRALTAHVREQRSELVLLPELPFSRWFCGDVDVDPQVWEASVEAHARSGSRLAELGSPYVLATRPTTGPSGRKHEGFLWDGTFRAAHEKRYLPNEQGYWEKNWYARGDGTFEPVRVGQVSVGFLICTELWFFEHAREYGKRHGAQILVTPRATERASVDVWLAGGRSAAIVAGAYCLSSNRVGPSRSGGEFGGQGWIVDPDGKVLGTTSEAHPFLTLDIDPSVADAAKSTYPRTSAD